MNILKSVASNRKSLYVALFLILFIVSTTVAVMLVSKNDNPKIINNDKSSETIAKEVEAEILNDAQKVEATAQPQETQNLENKEIGYMGEYVRKNYPIMDIEGCNEYIIESYIEGGCLSDFRNEDWFKMNYNYLQAGQKYSEGGVNMNTSIGIW